MLEPPENASKLYDIDEDLLYIKPKKDKLKSGQPTSLKDEGIYGKLRTGHIGGNGGSVGSLYSVSTQPYSIS